MAYYVTVFPTRAQVEWQQEGERATCLPLAFSTKIYAPRHRSGGPLPPALAGIQVLSPGASQMLTPKLQGAGLARGTGRAEVFMLLQAVSSVLVPRFQLPQEFPQYPRKLRALVDVLVPVAKV